MTRDAHRPRGPVWITTGLAVMAVAWWALQATVGAGPRAIGYAVVALSWVVAGVAVHRLRGTVPLHPTARRFWLRLLIAVGLLATGYAVLAAGFTARLPGASPLTVPYPAIAGVAGGVAVAVWAVGQVSADVVSLAQRWRVNLDRTIAFVGCATVLWQFGLVPMLTADGRWGTRSLWLVALTVGLAICSISEAARVRAGPVDRTALRLVAATGLIPAAAVLLVMTGGAGGPAAQALLAPLGAVLVTLAVRAQSRSAGAAGDVPGRSRGALPYLAAGGVDAALIAAAIGPAHWSDRAVMFAAVVVTALIAVRQLLAHRDNNRPGGDLRANGDRVHDEATHDRLTGLANRALFRERLEAALRQTPGSTVLLVNLDDFRTVNDSLGQDIGDRLLKSVAAVLRAAVGDDGLTARIGGDEFAVLLHGPTPTGETVAERLLDTLRQPVGEHGLVVLASIGIATATPGASPDSVLHHSDAALYAARQRGKTGYLRYVPGMEQPVRAEMQLAGDLRRALDRGEFRLAYQPIMGLEDSRIIGVEALVRWDHPTRGTISPVDFIPVAERTGLIVPLGRYVMREACRQAAAWLAEFGPDALQKIAPNVSARQLDDPNFIAEVAAALADSGLSSNRLVLELTESAVLRGRQVSQTLRELDRMGIKLALDDFGTGESSLSLLRSFPVAIIKLDKSFVDGIEIDDPCPATCDARQAVARAVMQLAGALRLDAVAEGIENAAQVQRLRDLGYSLGQGFHLGRPMPAEDLSRLLAAQRSMVGAA
ncbi:MAG TPA: EAL domain-containing protein [Catenuloplanes sp.]